MAGGLEFDWDAGNKKFLAVHNVMAAEFERMNDPLDWMMRSPAVRTPVVGITSGGRFLLAVWTVRNGKIPRHHRFPGRRFKRKRFLRDFDEKPIQTRRTSLRY